jgi:hypothetical protein
MKFWANSVVGKPRVLEENALLHSDHMSPLRQKPATPAKDQQFRNQSFYQLQQVPSCDNARLSNHSALEHIKIQYVDSFQFGGMAFLPQQNSYRLYINQRFTEASCDM